LPTREGRRGRTSAALTSITERTTALDEEPYQAGVYEANSI
jgi:hypothetical protein